MIAENADQRRRRAQAMASSRRTRPTQGRNGRLRRLGEYRPATCNARPRPRELHTPFNPGGSPMSDAVSRNHFLHNCARSRHRPRSACWWSPIKPRPVLPLIAELKARVEREPAWPFHLVVPALNSHLRHWLSDTDGAVSAAHRRGDDALSVFTSHGLNVTIEIGDSVPLLAIGDAPVAVRCRRNCRSRRCQPDRSHWLEHDLVNRVRARFDIPVRHVVAREEAVLAA